MPDLLEFVTHLSEHLDVFVRDHGQWTYGLIALIVFCETGLIVFPFLPGDSLLFATGALAARGGLNPVILGVVIMVASLLGDNVNYWAGRTIGPRVLRSTSGRLLSQKNLQRTHEFFEKHGRKAVVMARFVPIVRTFAPFTAGVGAMPYGTFLTFSLVGSLLWVLVCVSAGYFFGNIPIVRRNFELVVIAIVAVSLIPMLVELVLSSRRGKTAQQPGRADA